MSADLLTRVKAHFSREMRKGRWTPLYRDRAFEVGYTGHVQAYALKPLLRQFAVATTANEDREGKWRTGEVLLFACPHHNYTSRGMTNESCAAFLAELFGAAFATRRVPQDGTLVVVVSERVASEVRP